MTKTQRIFVSHVSNEAADSALVAITATAMTTKLAAKRSEGYCGWHNDCTNAKLLAMLKAHVDKGDMIDVMNFAAMLHVRSELYGEGA